MKGTAVTKHGERAEVTLRQLAETRSTTEGMKRPGETKDVNTNEQGPTETCSPVGRIAMTNKTMVLGTTMELGGTTTGLGGTTMKLGGTTTELGGTTTKLGKHYQYMKGYL